LVDGTGEALARSETRESALAWFYGKRLYGVGRGWGFLNRVSNDRQVFFSLTVGNSIVFHAALWARRELESVNAVVRRVTPVTIRVCDSTTTTPVVHRERSQTD
jgi:hypothetical protein